MEDKNLFYENIIQKENEYRSIPFWSWNSKLDKYELGKQIEWMKKQDIGGFFMHARGGLKTEYLGQEWLECVKYCAEKANQEGMKAWIYDENGWPSGFVGGKLLKNIEFRDRYLSYSIGIFDEKAMISYSLAGKTLQKATNEDKNCLNIYEHISNSTVDILNPKVVQAFLSLTHEKYKAFFDNKLNKMIEGFFTDEPQYYRYGHAYSQMLVSYFKETYNEDVFQGLGLLFVEKKGYKEFRYKYWKAMQQLMLNNFSKEVYDWCRENKVQFTGHYIEETSLTFQMVCCGGIMPYYEYETMPGIDKLGRSIDCPVAPKQVSSVARQLNKQKVLTETFACCGWDVTIEKLKLIAEWQYVNGVNIMCQHLLPYSEAGQGKRDHPVHFGSINPWVEKDFKKFNNYFSKLGAMLGESEEPVCVALFCPITSMYLGYKFEDFGKYMLPSDSTYQKLASKLSVMNIPYHIIDETILEKHGSVENDMLKVGACSYQYVVFPDTENLSKKAKELFEEYQENGGKIIFTGKKPEYVEGVKKSSSLTTNSCWKEIIESQPYSIDNFNTKIQSTYREWNDVKFIYAVNTSEEESYTITFNAKCTGLEVLNLEDGKIEAIGKTVTFAPCESKILLFSDKIAKKINQCEQIIVIDEMDKFVGSTDNYMLLDTLQYSFDGIKYSEKLRYMGVFLQLLNMRYDGVVFLKYTFDVKNKAKKMQFLMENMNIEKAFINGKEFLLGVPSKLDKQIFATDISQYVKNGKNEVVLKIYFHQKQRVYDVLFGENVQESLINCMAYDTTIESCYLCGDFAVYSDDEFAEKKEKNVLIGNNFYIDTFNRDVKNIVKDGFPFFVGNITFEKEIDCKQTPCKVIVKGHIHGCELLVNEQLVEKNLFEKEIDISQYILEGKNNIKVTIYNTPRNLFGPHHLKLDEDPQNVSPWHFELTGSWENGKSSQEREEYSFVNWGFVKKGEE